REARRARTGHDEGLASRDGGRARRPDSGSREFCPARSSRALAAMRLRNVGARQRVEQRGPAGETAHDRRDGGGGLNMTVVLTGNDLALEQLVRVARGGERVEVSPDAVARMQAGRATVERVLTQDAPTYGVTTG